MFVHCIQHGSTMYSALSLVMRIYMYMHTCTYMYMYTPAHTLIHTYECTRIRLRTYTHTHTHTHTHIHTTLLHNTHFSQVKSATNAEVVQLNQRLSSAREKNDQLHSEKVQCTLYHVCVCVCVYVMLCNVHVL